MRSPLSSLSLFVARKIPVRTSTSAIAAAHLARGTAKGAIDVGRSAVTVQAGGYIEHGAPLTGCRRPLACTRLNNRNLPRCPLLLAQQAPSPLLPAWQHLPHSVSCSTAGEHGLSELAADDLPTVHVRPSGTHIHRCLAFRRHAQEVNRLQGCTHQSLNKRIPM